MRWLRPLFIGLMFFSTIGCGNSGPVTPAKVGPEEEQKFKAAQKEVQNEEMQRFKGGK